MKKRFTSALLSLCLLMGLFSAAYAESLIVDNLQDTNGTGYEDFDEAADAAYVSDEIEINAIIDDGDATLQTHIYKVEIMWGDTAFAYGYTDPETVTWDYNTHTYYVAAGDERTSKGWRLVNKGTEIKLPDDTPVGYEKVTAGTDQNYVLLFNHSSKPVNANIALEEINAGGMTDDNITATLLSDDNFGVPGTAAASPNSFDYVLQYDPAADTRGTPVLYSSKKAGSFNNTSAAAYVQLDGIPTDGALNTTTHTVVARITVTLTLPADATVVTP